MRYYKAEMNYRGIEDARKSEMPEDGDDMKCTSSLFYTAFNKLQFNEIINIAYNIIYNEAAFIIAKESNLDIQVIEFKLTIIDELQENDMQYINNLDIYIYG